MHFFKTCIFFRHHPFLAAAAAARMNGFPGPPGFAPPHPMIGPSPFFRPPFPHPPNGDFHHPPGGHPPPMIPPPHHPHFFGPHRPMLTPRQIFMMQQNQNFNSSSGNTANTIQNVHTSSNSNSNNNTVLQDFHQSVVGDIRAGNSKFSPPREL